VNSQPRALVVAIDGPAGAGKSTVAKAVAARLGYLYIDTGAMYRAVTIKLLQQKIDLEDAEAVARAAAETVVELVPGPSGAPDRVFVDGADVTEAIRCPEVSQWVPLVAANAAVRRVLLHLQRCLAARGGVVMDGRDIGTVVLPHADLKIFLTASLAERAERRRRELAAKGVEVDLETVMTDIAARDRKDSTRSISPLVPAVDAVCIDTTGIPISQAVEQVLAYCRQRM
jgi:cytidylate kinase